MLSASKPSEPLVSWTDRGLHCAAGGFYIDPTRAVDLAIITHAHSDHARKGSRRYLCVSSGIGLLKVRLGKSIAVDGLHYGEKIQLGSVTLSFHSAGHMLGSAQVRIQSGSEVWVASGDYKRDPDPSCEAFEPVECDTFITEATFGTPRYIWDKNRRHGEEIHEWWSSNAARGRNSVLFGYSLGKAQRILAELAPHAKRPVVIHETMSELTECYRAEGRKLAPTVEMSSLEHARKLDGELILAPPSILESRFLSKLGEFETAFASGWMQGGTGWSRGSYDKGFVISDHADWEDLNLTIDQTRASRVFVQHRERGALVRHLRKRGIDAHPASALAPAEYARLDPVNLSLFL